MTKCAPRSGDAPELKADLNFVFRQHTSCLNSVRNSLGVSFFCRVKPSHKPRTTPKLNRVIFNLLLGPYYGIIVTIGRERSRANDLEPMK